MISTHQNIKSMAILPGSDSEFVTCPTVMTEEELIQFLRIPEISNAKNYRNVVENLKRTHGLPRIHLCGKAVYLTDAVKAWLENHITCGQ
jgi:CTP synthase (UTP-ammonia lyase)